MRSDSKFYKGPFNKLIYRILIGVVIVIGISFCSARVLADLAPHNFEAIKFELGKQFIISSKVLSEYRKLQVYVPGGYVKSEKSYPVIYILEGDKHYQHATIAVEKIQTSGWIPASIIVGIPNGENTNIRDFVDESDKFMEFMTNEVKPFIEKNFRTNGYEAVFGHQRSGTFVLQAFVKSPNEFDNYISANPYFRQSFIDEFEVFLDKNKNLDQALYFSMGTVLDNGSYNVEPAKKLADLLEKKAPKNLQWTYQYLTLHGVFGSANVTLYDALSVTFKDYQGPFIYSFDDFVKGNRMEGVRAYFKERAEKYNISEQVTVGSLMGLGFMLMDSGYPEEAVKVVSESIDELYPESMHLYRVLGRAYEKIGDYNKVVAAYEKMVQLGKKQNSSRLDYYEDQLKKAKQKL